MERYWQRKLLFVSAFLSGALVAIASPAAAAQARVAAPHDSLPLRHRVVRNTIALNAGSLRSLEVATQFTYFDGQRFILGASADAEQHLFVAADSSRTVQRMYWIQIEGCCHLVRAHTTIRLTACARSTDWRCV